jgi:hypothetical protein
VVALTLLNVNVSQFETGIDVVGVVVGVGVLVGVGVIVTVGVGVALDVGVTVCVGVTLGVGVIVGVGITYAKESPIGLKLLVNDEINGILYS